MVMDALRGYLQLANGLSDVTRQRALAAAKALATSGTEAFNEAAAVPSNVSRQVQALADDLVATSRSNRDLLVGLIRSEVERTVTALGVASKDDMESMGVHVRRIERQMGELDERLLALLGLGDEGAPAKKVPQAKKAATKKAAPAKKKAAPAMKKAAPATKKAAPAAASASSSEAGA